MIKDRLELARHLLTTNGVHFASINEIERATLDWQLRQVYGAANRIEEVIWVRDTMSNNSPTYSTNHEYVEVFARNRPAVEMDRDMFRETKLGFSEVMSLIGSIRDTYPSVEKIEQALRQLYQEHRATHLEAAIGRGETPEEGAKSDPWKGLYPYKRAEYRDESGRLVDEENARSCQAAIWVWRDVEPSMPAGKQADSIKDPRSDNYRFYRPPHPVTGRACKPPKRGWAFPQRAVGGRPSLENYQADNRIVFKEDENSIPQLKYFLHEVESVVSTSVVRQYADGEPKLEELFGRKGLIDNPKPPGLIERFVRQTVRGSELVLDYFAGSGTTAHSVINLNREDGERRRFVLVEVGHYFDTVLVPRVKKLVFSSEWTAGRPSRPATSEEANHSPHMIKLVRLESYEDALSNLDLKRTNQQGMFIDANAEMREQYILSYMLNVESRGSQSLLNVKAFRNPDQYKLRVERNGEMQLMNVDLVETFNWLLGLTVKHIDVIRGVRVIDGTNPQADRVLVLWRNLDELNNEKLDEWFEKQGYSTRDLEYDLVYVNGDNNLENLRRDDQTWKVRLIEEEFQRLMFDVQDV
jgi:adenine-specific DNA-methyltransferase